jgi:hypothetical protein
MRWADMQKMSDCAQRVRRASAVRNLASCVIRACLDVVLVMRTKACEHLLGRDVGARIVEGGADFLAHLPVDCGSLILA